MSVKLAHFDLIGQIGRGGMGTVFSAFDTSLQRHVAIKVLDEDRATDTEFVNDFIREAQNAAGISHPHIVQIYFAGECDGNYYIVMELLTGQTLDSLVQKEGPQPEPLALRIAIEVTEALKAAYAKEMVHGDVKPLNIMLTESSGSKLLDFGLAKLANVEADAKAEDIWGSPYYVSPERIGRKAEDFRSDIYSLGATIFELLTGRPPFVGENNEELAIKRLREKPPLVRTLNPNVSKKTEQILDKMLQKSPLQRYLDYDALLNDLWKAEAAVLGKTANVDTAEIMRVTRKIPVPPPKSNLPLILGSVVGVVLVAAVVAYLALGHKSEPAKTETVKSEPVKSAPVVTVPAAPSAPSETTTAAKKKQLPTPGIFKLDNKEVAVWPSAGVPGRPLIIVAGGQNGGSAIIKPWINLAMQQNVTVFCPSFDSLSVNKQISDDALSVNAAYFGDCLKWIEKNLQYDKANVFMTGAGTGGLATWLLGTKHPDFFRGLFFINSAFPKGYPLDLSRWRSKPIKVVISSNKQTEEGMDESKQALDTLKSSGCLNFSSDVISGGTGGTNNDAHLAVNWVEQITSGSPQTSSP